MRAPWAGVALLHEAACFYFIAPAIPYITAAAAAAGAAVSADSAVSQGAAQKSAEEYNAAVDRNNAAQAEESANQQAVVRDQQTQMQLGKQKAEYAASGVDVSQGTPVDVLTDTATQGRLDALTLRYGGQVRADANLSGAGLANFVGNQDQIAGEVSGATSLLTGVGKLSSQYSDNGWGGN